MLLRKWVSDGYVQGFEPEVVVYLEVFNATNVELQIQILDRIPSAATLAVSGDFQVMGNTLSTSIRVIPSQRRTLNYTLRFRESFYGRLPPATAIAGRIRIDSGMPLLWVDAVPLPADLPAAPVLLQRSAQLHADTAPQTRPMLSDIPFHTTVRERIWAAIKEGGSLLIVGDPDLWGSKLVEAAVNSAMREGYNAVLADSTPPTGNERVVGVKEMLLFVSSYDSPTRLLLLRMVRDRGGSIIAASSTGLEGLGELLSNRLGSNAVGGIIRSLFSEVIYLQPPAAEELAEYFRKELGDCLSEAALRRLLEFTPMSCDEAEAIVRKARSECEKKGKQISETEIAIIASTVIRRPPRGDRRV